MAETDHTRYVAIKGTDIMEFWTLFDAWEIRMKAKTDQIKSARKPK